MNAVSSGLRVLTKRNPYFSDDPQIVVFKLDANTMSFTEVHGSPEKLIGFSADRWLEPDFWPTRIHSDDREDALKFCLMCSEERRDHELEYRVVNAEGDVVWVHEIVEFDQDAGNEAMATGYIMNISNRVRQEQDVKEVLGMKDELFRVVMEDIGQPMTKISSFGDMLERHLSSIGDDVGSDFAVGLREGLQELAELVDGLTDAGRKSQASFDQIAEKMAQLRARGSTTAN